MTTLLEKMAQAVEPILIADFPNERVRARKVIRAALEEILTPTRALSNAGGLKAFSGPQPEGGPAMIYPALMWREMVTFIVEERDRERPDEAGSEGAAEGGSEPGILPEGADGRGSEPGEGGEAGGGAA